MADNLAAVVGDRLRHLRTQAAESVRAQARELCVPASSPALAHVLLGEGPDDREEHRAA
jgi:hypothetical protein